MPRQRGKPKHIYVPVDKIAALGDELKKAWMNLADAAKEMRESGLDSLHMRAEKALDYSIEVVEFASTARNLVEPTVLARRLGRKTYSEEQQEKYRRQSAAKKNSAKKSSRSPTKRRPKKKPLE